MDSGQHVLDDMYRFVEVPAFGFRFGLLHLRQVLTGDLTNYVVDVVDRFVCRIIL